MKQSHVMTGAVVFWALSPSAHAYLGPGTGSNIVQALLASIAAVLATVGVFWNWIKSTFDSLFRGKRSEAAKDAEDSGE